MSNNFLLLNAYAGLCNQLILLANAIIIAHSSNRLVCLSDFKNQYDLQEVTPIEDILDLDYLNTLLKDLNLNTSVITTFEKNKFTELVLPANLDITKMQSELMEHITSEPNKSNKYLTLGVAFSYLSDDPILNEKRETILQKFRFTRFWIDMANTIKSNLGLNNFKAIHLRLEDDMIHHLAHCFNVSFDIINVSLIAEYNKHIEKHFDFNEIIFISTGLGKYTNANNYYLSELIIKYPNIRIVDNCYLLDILKSKNYVGREFLAIVDFLIAKDSSVLLGMMYSSFTHCCNKNNILVEPHL
jgi:hypothetical protein